MGDRICQVGHALANINRGLNGVGIPAPSCSIPESATLRRQSSDAMLALGSLFESLFLPGKF